MSTCKIIASVASIAILGITIAVFRNSANTSVPFAQATATTRLQGRSVIELKPVFVYAPALPQATVEDLDTSLDTQLDISLPSLSNGSLCFDSRLYMPYYSFASTLPPLIKE